MMLAIKRKSDGLLVGNVIPGMTPEQEILINVIPNFGGAPGDYKVVEYTPEPTPEPEPEAPQLTTTERLAQLETAILELTMLLGGGE